MEQSQANPLERRLPTLLEVLCLRTKAPVDLWSFHNFMKEEYHESELLDFWLAVVKHLSLCRNYVRGLRQSIVASERDMPSSRTSSVLLDTLIQDGALDDTDSHRLSAFLRGEDPQGSPGNMYRLSTLLDTLNPKDQHLANEIQQLKAQKLQQINEQKLAPGMLLTDLDQGEHPEGSYEDQNASFEKVDTNQSNDSRQLVTPLPINPFEEKSSEYQDQSESPFDNASFYSAAQQPVTNGLMQPAYATQPRTTSALYNQGLSATPPLPATEPAQQQQQPFESNFDLTNAGLPPTAALPPLTPTPAAAAPGAPTGTGTPFTPSQPAPARARTGSGSRSRSNTSFVSRTDIKQSTHHIFTTFFTPGGSAADELLHTLPPHVVNSVRHAIEAEGRDDPEVFDDAREVVFDVMQQGAFPAFLSARAKRNVSPFGRIVRLAVGLFAIFAAMWVGFILIFLDWRPQERVRLWLVLPFTVGVYAVLSSLFRLDPVLALLGYSEAGSRKLIRVREPFVRRLLVKRAFGVLVLGVLVTAGFVCLFTFVPGNRL